MSIVQQLIDMGYPSESAQMAAGNNRNLDQALNYIESDGIGFDDVGTPSPSDSTLPTDADTNDVPTIAQSFKCDECGKLLPTDEAMIKHGQVTKHIKFSATTEKVLTVEQKQEQLAEIIRRMKEKNERKAEQVEEVMELPRSSAAQAMAGYREEAREREIREAAEQLRQKKIDDEAAKKHILEQIRLDRLDREERQAKAAAQTPAPAPAPLAPAPKDHTITNIQFRLWDGQVVKQEFKVDEPLIMLRGWLEANFAKGTPFTMMTPFPRRIFQEEDMGTPLQALNLVPTASIALLPRTVAPTEGQQTAMSSPPQ